jgi:drug/metabolite transporter (DMT)-like permease
LIVVLLGLLAAACFGAMTVAIRAGLQRVPDPEAATFVTAFVGFVVAALVDLLVSRGADDLASHELWPFFLAGLIAPGAAGLLFIVAVWLAGAARTAVLITAAPLLAAVPAFLLLGEPFHVALAGGAVLIVAGAAILGSERLDTTEFRRIGLLVALVSAALIAVRDNFARWAAKHHHVSGLAAGTAALAAAAALVLAYLLVTRRARVVPTIRRAFRPFVPAGVLLGLAYAALLEALTRGRVTIVTPLYATESFWTFALAGLVLGRSERIGVRLVLLAGLMVAGAALIGAFR